MLHAEWHDCRRSAEDGADAAGSEAIGHHGALGGETRRLGLVEVAMGVDAAGKHKPPAGVDRCARRPPTARRQRRCDRR